MQKAVTQLLGFLAGLEHSIIVARLQSGPERTVCKGGKPRNLTDDQITDLKKLFSDGMSKSKLAEQFSVLASCITS